MPRHAPKTCDDCQKEYVPVRKHQKLCRPCRLLSDLDYWNEHVVQTRKCEGCQAPYFRTNRSTELCGICEPGYRNSASLECLICHAKDHSLERSHTPICRQCARWPDEEVRAACRTKLREWIAAPVDPYAGTHPLLRPVLIAADAAAQRLGTTREVTLSQAKAAMGLRPGAQTKDYDGLRAALELL